MKMSNTTYDILKQVSMKALPAIVTCWLAIGKIWNVPYYVEIGATISALNVCLSACLGVSTKNYDGSDK